MTRHSLNFEQATRICHDFQYLTGTKFMVRNTAVPIEHIAVTPFDDLNKYIFFVQFREAGDVVKSLELYSGDEYDVVIVGKVQSDKTEVVYKHLDSYLQESKIPFDANSYVQESV
jgi:hypothetical protein